jgi:thiol-disulfide isomerase/thioredoxin
MGNRNVLYLIIALAAAAVVAGAFVMFRATAVFEPDRNVAVLDQPQTPGRARGVADFTVIDPPRPAPAAAFTDGSGQQRTIADFRGRVVLLNLWATWCAPCIKEMPSLDRLQAQLGGPDFTVLALSQDRKGAEVVKPFYDKEALTHLDIQIDAKGAVTRELEVQGLPTSVLIDRQGRIVGRVEGPAEWDSPEWIGLLKKAIAAPAAAGS